MQVNGKKLTELLQRDGGFSIHSNGLPAAGKGYVVSLPDQEVRFKVRHWSDIPPLIRQYASTHCGLMAQNQVLGAWIHGGFLYLDVSVIIDSLETALRLAGPWGQLAIWDLREKKEIFV